MAIAIENGTITTKNRISNFWKLVICIVLCEAVGLISGLLSQAEMSSWFATLNKPDWNPPSYLFGPVWTFLYLLMAISLWLVWKSDAPENQKRNAQLIFALQLFLNFWWSILFFKLHSPLAALVDIVLMVVIIIITIFRFASISRTAAWLLVPYISWVCFATILNFTIWFMN